ncbi:hypothetical protein ACTJKN_22510 [Pedobacter sp. 22163]|uniref:hypothetical protein n=1 Tax=Pedobacter sp. 22163 TaxID=3453883 RepID=UPI003F825A50
MEKSSHKISKVVSYDDGHPIYFLTGNKYYYQTIYCIRSLITVSSEKFKFILVDDGSFDSAMIKEIEHQIHNVIIIDQELISKNIEVKLPKSQYPLLHKKREEYPHIKKLTDIHTLDGDWKIVLDSDMLFWDSPSELIDWIKAPGCNIYMRDCVQSYGYSTRLMEKLCGNRVPELVNVGIIGLNSNDIDWEDLEVWCKNLEENEGTSYYLEQAITAMLLSRNPGVALSPQTYIVNPTAKQVEKANGILHHYVDLSKVHYFNLAWKKIML